MTNFDIGLIIWSALSYIVIAYTMISQKYEFTYLNLALWIGSPVLLPILLFIVFTNKANKEQEAFQPSNNIGNIKRKPTTDKPNVTPVGLKTK